MKTTCIGAYKAIHSYKHCLSKQQYNTLKGQVKAGDVDGAMRGLGRLLSARRVCK